MQSTVQRKATWCVGVGIVAGVLALAGASVHLHARRDQGCPTCGPRQQKPGEWDWGKVLAGATYQTKVDLVNTCDVPADVTVTVNVPFLSWYGAANPSTHTLPAKSTRELLGYMQFPQPPCHKPIYMAAAMKNPWVFGGTIVMEYGGQGDTCLARTETYTVIGDLEIPPCPKDTSGPEKLQTTDPCELWWLTGAPPRTDDPDLASRCLEPIRGFAREYRDRALQPLVDTHPERWTWLPTSAQIATMSIADLLAMRDRALATALQP